MAAAILSGRKDLNHRVRSLIVSHVPAFDIHSPDEAAEALTSRIPEGRRIPGRPTEHQGRHVPRFLEESGPMASRWDLCTHS